MLALGAEVALTAPHLPDDLDRFRKSGVRLTRGAPWVPREAPTCLPGALTIDRLPSGLRSRRRGDAGNGHRSGRARASPRSCRDPRRRGEAP
jgi:hypothetical protein